MPHKVTYKEDNDSLVDHNTNNHKKSANRRQDYGVSKLARALFKPMPQKTSEASLLVLQKVTDSLRREYRALIHPGNLHEYYREFHGAYGSQCHKYMKIAPFNFDVPSPDDIVAAGWNTSKAGQKASVVMETPSSNVIASDDSSSVQQKSGHEKIDKSEDKKSELIISSSTSTKSTCDSMEIDRGI